MSEGELILEGNRYKGRFIANEKKGEFWTGSHYSEHQEERYWWAGTGVIEDKQTNEKYRFLLETQTGRMEMGLEQSILCFDEHQSHDENPNITDYPAVVDLALKALYEDVKNSEDEEIIPIVGPTILKFEELVEQGYVSEVSGQRRLQLAD